MINNPSSGPAAETSRVTRAVWVAMQTQSANNAKNFITKMAKEETAAALQAGADIGDFAVGVSSGSRTYLSTSGVVAPVVQENPPVVNTVTIFGSVLLPLYLFFPQGMDVSLFKSAYESPKYDFLLSHAAYCQDVLKLKKGQRAVISNGRVSQDLESPTSYQIKFVHVNKCSQLMQQFNPMLLFPVPRSSAPWRMTKCLTRTTSSCWRASS